MGGPPEKKGKLEIVKTEPTTIIKEEPIESGGDKSINNATDSVEQNNEIGGKNMKAEEIKSEPKEPQDENSSSFPDLKDSIDIKPASTPQPVQSTSSTEKKEKCSKFTIAIRLVEI